MIINKFKNGNVNAKLEKCEIEKLQQKNGNVLNKIYELFYNSVDDIGILSNEYCLSNFDCAVDLFDFNKCSVLCVPFSSLMELLTGKTVKFYSRKATTEEIEKINSED